MIVNGNRKVAGLVIGVVSAQPVQRSAVLTSAAPSHPPPKAMAILWRRHQGAHLQHVGKKSEVTATADALHVVKKHEVTAMVALE